MTEEDQKEGLFKRLKNIESKNEVQLQLFSKVNNINRLAKNKSDYNYNNKFAFYKFYRDIQNFKKSSMGSKYSYKSEFYHLLNKFAKHQVATHEKTREHKTKVYETLQPLF